MRTVLGTCMTGLVGLLALTRVMAPASAATYYVCPSGGGHFLTIQEAIDVSENGDEVIVCDGVLTGAGNRDLSFGGRAIRVRSANGPDYCIIDCQGTYTENHRGFYFASGETADAIVEGFTIRNGYTDGGGAVYCEFDSDPTIINCIITGNVAEDYGTGGTGGGIFCFYASPTITSCTFKDNTAASGGGIYTYEADSVVLDCVITDNDAEYGGGVYFWGDVPDMRGCTISRNRAGNNGGGVCCVYSNAAITNCILTENVASTEAGGALYCFRSSPALVNSTIVSNQATAGGALRCYSNSSPTITNCILWDNTPDELSVQSGTPAITYSDIKGGWTGTGNINLDPKFLVGYYLAQIAAGQTEDSPCVDAGDPASGMIAGTTRTDGVQDAGIVDMGYHYPGPAVCRGDLDCDGKVDFGDINPFVLALSNWEEWKRRYPNCPEQNADVNGDGQYGGVNGFGDINPFVALLASGGGQPIPCPTP